MHEFDRSSDEPNNTALSLSLVFFNFVLLITVLNAEVNVIEKLCNRIVLKKSLLYSLLLSLCTRVVNRILFPVDQV